MLKRLFGHKDPEELLDPNLGVGWKSDEWGSWEAPVNLIVGESHYEAAFDALAGPPRPRGYLIPVLVNLLRDPANPYDTNAIRAEVEGHTVGYVARDVAAILAPRLDRLRITSFVLAGVIRGGSTSAANFGVHVWTERRASPSPGLAEVPAAAVPWPPSEDAFWEPPPASSAPLDPVERYVWLSERVEEMWQHRLYLDVLPMCLETLDLLSHLDSTEWGIRDASAFEYATLLMGVLGDVDGLARLREHPNIVGLEQPVQEIEEASRDAIVVEAVLALVAKTRGLVQKDLPASLPGVSKDRIRRVCYWAAVLGRVDREKAGASYRLSVPRQVKASQDAIDLAISTFREHPDAPDQTVTIEDPRPLDDLLRPMDARLNFGSAPAPYDDPEGYERWRRHYDEVQGRTVERNLRGIQAEKVGDLDAAIDLYEANVRDGFEGNHPYDRLTVIYRRQRKLNEEMRVLERAIEVFSQIQPGRPDANPKLAKFRTRLERVRALAT